ncbi:unnamed protein product [Dicrocoelium dendriticum]|nr:unnamed protein product [Dicrocoelium dendriticum]
MAARSTLIVAGRSCELSATKKLEKLLFHSLISAFGDEAAGADAEFSQLTATFTKPSREDEFGLTFYSQIDNTPHLVRVQFNPTAEQFRAALRESLSHALNATRLSESEPSIDGRVAVVYVGQVVAQTGEWLLADSALAGYQVFSWLDSDAAQAWWPQLQKFPNIGDKLTLNLVTPLAGPETSWSAQKNGHTQKILSHVDVRMVQLTVHIDGSWRSNGKPVLLEPSQTASYEGIRGFVQLALDQHQVTQTAFDADGTPPLGCALSAPRPALYLFPGGGLGSPSSALFSLRGFAMLFGGSFTSQRPPVWWSMVRNLSKLDAVVLPDWSPSNLLTYRFVNDLIHSGINEAHIFGELILPPSLTSTPSETATDLLLTPPSSTTGPHESTWAGNNLASEALPTSTVLYFKLGWGELRLQPLAQRAGLMLLWTSTVHQDSHASPLRILLPTTQLPGATPVQGLGRLLKALVHVPQVLVHGSSVTSTVPGKSTHKPSSDSSSRSTSASKPTTTPLKSRAATVTSAPSTKAPPPKTSVATARPATERPSTARQTDMAPSLPKKTVPTSESKPQQRPSTAPTAKASPPAKTIPAKSTTRLSSKPTALLSKPSVPSTRPTGATKPPAPSTADRLATHSNLVASKQIPTTAHAKPRPKAPPTLPTVAPTKSDATVKGELSSSIPEEATPSDVSVIPTTLEVTPPPDVPKNMAIEVDQQLRDSLELAPMDPLMSGWRSMEQSLTTAAHVTPEISEPDDQNAPPVDYPTNAHQMAHPLQGYSDVYEVHKAEHFHEADESDTMDDIPVPSVDDEFPSIEPVKQPPAFAESTAVELSTSSSLPTAFIEGESRLPDEHFCAEEKKEADEVHASQGDARPYSNLSFSHPGLEDSSVSEALKLIDPAVTDSYPDGLHLTESGVDTSLFRPPCYPPSSDELVLPAELVNASQSESDYRPDEVNEPIFPNVTDSIAMSRPPFGVGYEEVEGVPHAYDDPVTESAPDFLADTLPKSTPFFSEQGNAEGDGLSDQFAHAVPVSPVQSTEGESSYPLDPQGDSLATFRHYEPFCAETPLNGVIEGDGAKSVQSLEEEYTHFQMRPGANLPDARDSIPQMIPDASENQQEYYQSSTKAVFNERSSPIVTGVSGLDVNVLEPDAKISGAEVTVGSEVSELVYHGPGSPERQSSDISDMDANDHELWASSAHSPSFPDYAHTQSHSAFAEREPFAIPVRDAVSTGFSEAVHESSDVNETNVMMDASPGALHHPPDSSYDSTNWHQQPIRLSADSLEEAQRENYVCDSNDPAPPAEDSVDSTTCVQSSHVSSVPFTAETLLEQVQTADSTTLDEAKGECVQEQADTPGIPMGFDHLVVDATGDHSVDAFNLGSPTSETSMDSVVHAGKADSDLHSPDDFHDDLVTSSVRREDHRGSDPTLGEHRTGENGYVHEYFTNGHPGLINGNHEAASEGNRINGSFVSPDQPASFPLSTSPASKMRITPELLTDVGATPIGNRSELVEPGMSPFIDPFDTQQSQLPADDAVRSHVSDQFDPIQAWGQPQGLPAPVVPSTANKGTSLTPAAPPVLPPGPPVYLDLIWVPSYLVRVPHQLAVEFFNRVRSRTYVLSGEALHPTIGEALIEGKSRWGSHDLETLFRTETPAPINVLPTDEPYEWSCWLRTPCGRADRETGESRLQAGGFHVLPAASLCDIEYSAGDTAFRCEGVRVDL